MDNTSVLLNHMNVLSRLTGVRRGGRGVAAKCPAHDDKKQSLGIAEGDGRILIKCYAGCSTQSVITAMGITWKDLFSERITMPSRYTLGEYQSQSLPVLLKITQRTEVKQLTATGMTQSQIGEQLGISQMSVSRYQKAISKQTAKGV